MHLRRAWVAAILLTLALQVSGQQERTPFFSLSSDRTYAPGERPRIHVWAQNVDSLDFRVYRVKDPLLFFAKLEDAHSFGGRAPRLPVKQNWLENFHDWKVELRSRVRDVFRGQFTAESRARIRDWWVERQRERVERRGTTQFAQVPLLNAQQLVSEWRQNVRTTNRWESLTIPVDVPGKGLYLVEATQGELRAYTILNVTELGIVTKISPGHVLAFVQNRKSGVPVPDCPVFIRTNRKEAARLKTDARGLAETVLTENRPEDTLVLARLGDDFAVASLSTWNLSTDPERFWTGYIYTDRPVYRPGHTVHFKGILRTELGAEYRIPERRDVEVEIHDPENHAIFRKTLTLSPAGTIQGEYPLPESAALGYYSVQVRAGEAETQGGFHVEEYKKPEYEVRVTPEVRRVLQGQPVKVTLEAKYYFGEPVARAKVTYVVHRVRYWSPYYAAEDEEAGGEGEGEGSGEGEEESYGGEQESGQTGQLDADGKLTVNIPTRVSKQKWDENYRIEARVTDQGNREIAGHAFVLATYGSFLVHMEPEQYVYAPSEIARFKIEARDYDNQPIATAARVEFYSSRSSDSDKKPLFTAESRTDNAGKAKVEIPLRQAGSFYARVSARTPEGREVESRSYLWVSGGAAEWYGERRERVQIIPDKKSYRPGETARVLILTGVADAHLLVTTEGRELHSRQVIASSGASVMVEVPVRPEYAPNFYVGVAFLRDNQLYQGSKNVRVPPLERQLTVEVQPSKPQYRPGEPVVFNVTARDSTGKPVAAELSLGVVDEAIYAIRPEAAQDIVKFFYGNTYNRVSTETSLSYFFHGQAGKRAMQLAMVNQSAVSVGTPGDLAQIKPERLVEPRVRKAFPDTAFWVANLMTDASGRGQARFSFPDSLTTWRATARAITRDTRVGSTVQRTLVRKNLILRLAVPRFFTLGDEVTISALVHNYLASEKTARVSLAAEGLDILEGATRDVMLPSRGDARVDWRIRALPGHRAKLLGKALTDEESDALELTLPVIPYGVKLSLGRAGALSDTTAETETELLFPQQIEPTSRSLELSVAPSLAGTVFGALDYLTSFPWGCTEQTMSSFLPNIIVAQAMKDLGVKSNVDTAALQKKIREGLERLYDFQHEDGGWGWWKADESGAFMTAYVLSGLSQAQAAGYTVREDSIRRGRQWLRAAFDREKRALPDLRAYLAYALIQAGSQDRTVLDAVWEQRAELTAYGRALLGLALNLVPDARAGELAGQLEAQVKSEEREAYWPADRDTLMDFYGDATPEVTAYALKLLTRLRPQSPLLPKAALYLVNHRSGGYYWSSTKQTAMVIYGLTDYLKASGELKPNFSVTVSVNGKQVLSGRFTEADALAPTVPVVRIPAAELAAGANKVRISKTGEGKLYWSARAEYFSTEEKLQRTGSVSLNLLREYFRLVPAREAEKIVYHLQPLQGALAPGDVLVVRLTVSGGDWRYLMVEDPIPAGTEFIERDDLYEVKDRPSWWNYWFTRREFHNDRAAFFQTHFDRGQTQYLYLLKVVNPGRFRVSPARVEPMYQPQYLSTTESKTVDVK